MPSRLLSPKINVSNSFSRLTALEEVVFIHLIVSCDDYGRFYGHPDILKGMLFSRREFTAKQIESAIAKLEEEGMIRRYENDGTVYIELTSWMKYQSPRAKSSKYPSPDADESCVHMIENADICEREDDKQNDDSPVMFTLPLNKGEHQITSLQLDKYKTLYPSVDIEQEIRNMIGWLDSNPSRRKTASGIKSFITRWLSKKQDQNSSGTKIRNVYTPNHEITDGQSDENPFRR